MQKNRPKGRNREVREVDDGGLLKKDLGFHVTKALRGGDKTFSISRLVIFLQKFEREGKIKMYSRPTGKKKDGKTVVVFKAA